MAKNKAKPCRGKAPEGKKSSVKQFLWKFAGPEGGTKKQNLKKLSI
jgi:hypothetical protein